MTARAEPGAWDAQGRLSIDLDALGANWRALAARVAPADCGAAVKADAYGLGIGAAVPALARAGCRTFFVAHISEGRRARAALRAAGQDGRILVLHGFHPTLAPPDAFRADRLEPVLGSAEEIAAWIAARAAWPEAERPGAAIHVDTGMNRLGLSPEAAAALPREAIEGAGATLVMTHLVAAEVPDDPITTLQLRRFAEARRGALGALPASIANSSGIFRPERPFEALVRPGYALYGGNPTPDRTNPMRAVVSLEVAILQLRDVPAGATAGYNGRWAAPRPSRLATLALGYADGMPISGSGIGGGGLTVTIAGVPCPLVGRISMDLAIADVTEVAAGLVRPGDAAVVMDAVTTVEEVARASGTIGYEILVNLGRRHSRTYRGDGTGRSTPSDRVV